MRKRTMSDALRAALRSGSVSFWSAMPGRIEDYNEGEQRASVKPLLQRRGSDGEAISRPIITGVPLMWPAAGGASVTMPVKRGDGVLIVFVDRSMDKWLTQGGETLPDDSRAHDYNDAVAIPGLFSFADATGHDNTATEMQYAGSSIRLEESGDITIQAAGDVNVSGGTFNWESS